MAPIAVRELPQTRSSSARESPTVSQVYHYRPRYDTTGLQWQHLLGCAASCQWVFPTRGAMNEKNAGNERICTFPPWKCSQILSQDPCRLFASCLCTTVRT